MGQGRLCNRSLNCKSSDASYCCPWRCVCHYHPATVTGDRLMIVPLGRAGSHLVSRCQIQPQLGQWMMAIKNKTGLRGVSAKLSCIMIALNFLFYLSWAFCLCWMECGDEFILGALSSLTSRTPVLQCQSANLAMCSQPPTRGYTLFGPYTCFWEQTGTEVGLGGGSRDLAGEGLLLRRGLKAPLWHQSGVISEERSGARIEGWIWNPSSSCPCLSFLLVWIGWKKLIWSEVQLMAVEFPSKKTKR